MITDLLLSMYKDGCSLPVQKQFGSNSHNETLSNSIVPVISMEPFGLF